MFVIINTEEFDACTGALLDAVFSMLPDLHRIEK
jgi:hypothetical protein